MSVLGDNVRRLRHEHGWSQKVLSEKCGSTSIAFIETGHVQSPTYATLESLARCFGCTIASLFSDQISNRTAKKKGGTSMPCTKGKKKPKGGKK